MRISGKWTVVFFYTVCIFIVTPYLPQLIQAASSRWSRLGVSRFVLGVEIAIALLILAIATIYLIYRKKRSALFLIYVGGIFLLSFIIYQFIPNPYEFTHLPEYAILSILIVRVLDKKNVRNIGAEKEKNINSAAIKNSYFLSGAGTGFIGIVDEIYQYFLPNRYFTFYDIFLNILGGILGLLIFWGIKKS